MLGRYTIVVVAYILDHKGVNLILGPKWFETHGKTTMDWKLDDYKF